ncbi:MAG: outer membrane beta-barrel protein [Bacteroidales bacterium]|nr:outer membrane beta-barrel protein [Bacteroidales bacterium]
MTIKPNVFNSKGICKGLRILLVYLLMVSNASLAYGQADADAGGFGLKYGFKLGTSLNQFSQPGTLIGFNGGFVGFLDITDFMDFEFELLYTLQGGGRAQYRRDLTEIGGNVETVTYLNRMVIFQNLEIPLSLRFTLPALSSGDVIPRIVIGGDYAFNVAAFEVRDTYYEFTNSTSGMVTNDRENVGAEYEKHQVSIHGGFAIDFRLADGKWLNTEIRYRQGINNVNSNQDDPQLRGILYTNTLSFNFGVTF